MADTLPNELEEAPQSPAMNGKSSGKHREIDNLDLDDPEVQKDMQRPAHIKNDIKEMDRNKRVSLILNSEAFREELEAIIDSQLKVRLSRQFTPGPREKMLFACSYFHVAVFKQI